MAVLAVSMLAVGCGGGDCAPRTGTYRVTLVRRDGNCGPIPEQVTAVDDTSPPSQLGCTGARTKSKDNCEVTASMLNCGGVQITGTLKWNTDSTRATSITSVAMVSNGSITCQGTYDVTYTKT